MIIIILVMIMMMMLINMKQVSVLERMDEGLKVLECLLPAYFKVNIVINIIIVIVDLQSMIVIIIVIVFKVVNHIHTYNTRITTCISGQVTIA